MQTKYLILSGSVLIGGGLLYWWWSKHRQPATGLPSQSTSLVPGSGTALATSGTSPTTMPISGGTAIAVAGSAAGALTSANMPPAIQQWAASLPPNNQAQFYKIFPTMTKEDIDNLNDLIANNRWGQPETTPFWDHFRTTYHVLDNTYLNYVSAGQVRDILNARAA